MLAGLKDVLAYAEKAQCAIAAFNVYNMETAMGVFQAAEETGAPVIMQVYSRLFASGNAEYLAPIILQAAKKLKTPAAFHLDHGASDLIVEKALRIGASAIMIDGSSLPFEKNVALTAEVVRRCSAVGVDVEGELGHIGTTNDDLPPELTSVEEAEIYVEKTGVSALAIMVGTAHGRYKQIPHIDVERINQIRERTDIPLVLHGGSGVPEDQMIAAVKAGIRKVNFGTDLCYAFMDAVRAAPAQLVAPDVAMADAITAVKQFAVEKIRLLSTPLISGGWGNA